MKINLVMIVKNESRCLSRCLEKAAPLVDDMIVVDTGSSDGTRSIALSMGAKVWDYPWIDDFSAARNFALDCSDGDWNLVLDGDEYLRKGTRQELESAIRRISREKGERWLGAITICNSYQEGEEASVSLSLIPRLLPRGVRYEGAIHEQPAADYPCYRVPAEAEHDGYLLSGKGERNLPYLEKAVKECPEDPYYQYQLAATLRNLNRLEESLEWFRKFYKGSGIETADKGMGYRTEGVLRYLYTLLDLNRPELLEEAREVITREEAVMGGRPDYWFVCGIFYMKLVLSDVGKYIGLLPRIEGSFLRCLSLGERPELGGAVGTGSFKAAYNLGLWYELSGDLEKARDYYSQSAAMGYRQARERLKLLDIG